jgi:hypothetical protein
VGLLVVVAAVELPPVLVVVVEELKVEAVVAEDQKVRRTTKNLLFSLHQHHLLIRWADANSTMQDQKL